jgi:hypothetical protein
VHDAFTKIEKGNPLSGDEVFKAYCSGSKQTKSFKLVFSFISPKNPSGWPMSTASEYMMKVNEDKSCLIQESLYRLSQEPGCQTHYGHYMTDLRGEKMCSPTREESPLGVESRKGNQSR